MRYCIFCGKQVSDGVLGRTSLISTLYYWFGGRGIRMAVPVAESAMTDEREHMVFEHGFAPISVASIDGKIVYQGPWVCFVGNNDLPHDFGEVWERVNPMEGKRILQPRTGNLTK